MTITGRAFSLGPLFWAFVAAVDFWAVGAMFCTPAQLIEICNAILISAGAGVSVAYAPAAMQAFREPAPTRGDVLSAGIWVAWLAILGERVLSFLGRIMHKDITFFNTHIHTFILSATVFAGLMHLLAPEGVAGRLPAYAWYRFGGLVFFAMLALTVTILRTGF